MKKAYKFDRDTMLYISSVDVHLVAGYSDYIKPRFSTWEPLPEHDASTQRCRMVNGSWSVEQIPEVIVYNSETGDELIILEGQDIPDGYQETPPPQKTDEELFNEELNILNYEYEVKSGELANRHAQAVARDGSTETEKVAEIRTEIAELDLLHESDQATLINKYYGV